MVGFLTGYSKCRYFVSLDPPNLANLNNIIYRQGQVQQDVQNVLNDQTTSPGILQSKLTSSMCSFHFTNHHCHCTKPRIMELKYDQSKRGHNSFTNQFASYMVISLIRMSLICTLKWKVHVQGVGTETDKRDLDIKLLH